MEVLACRMQTAMDTWEGGSRATGGALKPEKEFWYIISFQWTQCMWRYGTVAETPTSVSVLNAAGNMVVLDWLEVNEARKTLGVTTAPDGNITTEYELPLRESHKWASQVKSGNLRKMDA
jgi:hypothetical protein